ncbi:MAG: NAD(P)-dependent oxidoreductase [Chloroflexota bacterium]|nr:NAD(P)-dependent oxidoreductase [Chloroflexota bacterium]
MKAIVFGGSGFIGSHVADCLTEAGYQVAIFDLEPSPYLLPGQEMILGNILDEAAVLDAVNGCDYVYHLAGIADLDDATTKPLDTVQQNVMGTTVILEAAWRSRVKRFVYASTIYVYSDKGGFYRCSKQAAELYIEEYNKRFGLDYTVVRYGTIYGPRADSRNSVYRYLKQAIESGSIICPGSGDEMREYIHVKDVARLSVDILADEYRNQYVIMSGHQAIRFKDLLYMIREILANQVEIEFKGGELDAAHYNITPYSFVPRIGHKLVTHYYVDMGQGLLECISEIYGRELANRQQEGGV